MSDCVYVVVYVPAASLSYEVLLPTYVAIAEMQALFFEMLQQQMQGVYVFDKTSSWYVKRLQCVLNTKHSLSKYGICNGDAIVIW